MARFEYTGDEFADQAIRVIVSTQMPFYGDKPRMILGFSVRYQRLSPARWQGHRAGIIIEQPAGSCWSVYRKNDRSHHASALTRVTKRGEAYLIEGSRMAGETRIAFGDALLFALDMAAKVEQFRSG